MPSALASSATTRTVRTPCSALACAGAARTGGSSEAADPRPCRCRRDCEGYGIGIGGNRLWDRTYADRMAWNLEQAREKLCMYQRYAAKLRAERYDGHWVKALAVSGVVAQMAEAREKHLWRAWQARRQKWAPLITEALSKAHTLKEEEAWQTPTT
ncbi:putative protein OS=Streptomyces microflavus OX=1919 GN=Smic_80930 PE=4 SV=1 [Streptomyces microflavus]